MDPWNLTRFAKLLDGREKGFALGRQSAPLPSELLWAYCEIGSQRAHALVLLPSLTEVPCFIPKQCYPEAHMHKGRHTNYHRRLQLPEAGEAQRKHQT